MTDHAARALVLAQSGEDCFDQLEPEAQESAREHVRAMLRAIREPSDLMRSHGQWAISDNLTVSVCVENNSKARAVWPAMIDTALSGGEE